MYTYFSDKLLNCYHDVLVVLQKQEIGNEDSCFPSTYTWRDEQLKRVLTLTALSACFVMLAILALDTGGLL